MGRDIGKAYLFYEESYGDLLSVAYMYIIFPEENVEMFLMTVALIKTFRVYPLYL